MGIITRQILLLLLLFSVGLTLSTPPRRSYIFVTVKEKNVEEDDSSTQDYYILYLHYKQAKRIPNIEILQYFIDHHEDDEHSNNIDDLPVISRQFLNDHFHHNNDSVPEIAFKDIKNATLTKITTLSPPSFIWKERYNVFPDTFNPCLVYMRKGYKLLLAFRKQILDAPILFTWFDLKKLKVLDDDYEYGVNPSLNYLDLPKTSTDEMKEDPRLLLRQDGSVSILYHDKASFFAPVRFNYFNITFNPHPRRRQLRIGGGKWTVADEVLPEINLGNKIATLSPIVDLYDHPYASMQKNWIMFEARNATYFIQSLNPFHLLLYVQSYGARAKLEVVLEKEEITLPWTSEYGLPLRGGTPALLLTNLSRFYDTKRCLKHVSHHQKQAHLNSSSDTSGATAAAAGHEILREVAEIECFQPPDSLYVMFFHSVATRNHYHHHTVDHIRTYYMGAVTLCPSFPFDMYSISPHPILLEEYYQLPWASLTIDHVMFPIGLFQIPEEPDYLWISFGYEDKHGAIGKFHIFDLLKSMEHVNNTMCV